MIVRTLTSSLRQIPKLRPVSTVLNVCHSLSTTSSASRSDEEFPARSPPLISFENAALAFPGDQKLDHSHWTMEIQNPSEGGHAVLGRNGAGKSLLSSTLANHRPPMEPDDDNPYNNPYVRQGSLITSIDPWYSSTVAHVSFESHQSILAEGGTAYKAITGSGRGLLSKAAQFLVVRFGLYSLIHRDVDTLSTGEIRKVMLIRALAQRPRLLVLDNAFDGLDVDSREALKEIVSKTIKGFTLDILVQGISAKATAHTQVLLMTHRPEEIVEEIQTVSILSGNKDNDDIVKTLSRNGRSGEDLMQLVSQTNLEEDNQQWSGEPWSDPTLPAHHEIQKFWNDGRDPVSEPDSNDLSRVKIQDLSVTKGDAELLHQINWEIEKGQHWLVGGGNGAGKSTLSRILAKDNSGIASGSLQIMGQEQTIEQSNAEDARRKDVGWVSTELHMATAHSTQTASQVLEQDSTPSEFASMIAKWLQLDGIDLNEKFASLSQGQQKMILIGAALASRPKILVLDEPCQGLDFLNRNRVLGLVELFCQSTDISLVYITHHMEELIPSISHAIHMKRGRAVYQGRVESYNPKAAEKE